MSGEDGRELDSSRIFNLVFIGWCWFVAAIFMPILVVGSFIELFSDPRDAAEELLAVALLPLIAAIQGLIIGAAVVLGLWLRRRCGARLPLLRGKRVL